MKTDGYINAECQICGKEANCTHHINYFPEEVTWLCNKCHISLHKSACSNILPRPYDRKYFVGFGGRNKSERKEVTLNESSKEILNLLPATGFEIYDKVSEKTKRGIDIFLYNLLFIGKVERVEKKSITNHKEIWLAPLIDYKWVRL